MKNILLIILFSGIWLKSYAANNRANGRFSVEVAPAFSINRLYCNTQPPFTKNGMCFLLNCGVAYHFSLKENCSISLGLSYAFGHIGLQRVKKDSLPAIKEQQSIQSLWFPSILRLYTNEIMIDTSIFLNTGLVPVIHVTSRPISKMQRDSFITHRRYGFLALLGGGLKYNFSLNCSFLLGLSYYLDLAGVMQQGGMKKDQVVVHNDFACVSLCVLF